MLKRLKPTVSGVSRYQGSVNEISNALRFPPRSRWMFTLCPFPKRLLCPSSRKPVSPVLLAKPAPSLAVPVCFSWTRSVRLMSAPASNSIFTIVALPFLDACASDDMP